MVFKLGAAEKSIKEDLVKELKDGEDSVEEAIRIASKAIARAVADVEEAVSDYEVTRQRAEQFRNEVAAARREELEGKSEKWRESDVGAAAEEFVSGWETDSLEEEMEEVPSVELQYEVPTLSEVLEALPDGE